MYDTRSIFQKNIHKNFFVRCELTVTGISGPGYCDGKPACFCLAWDCRLERMLCFFVFLAAWITSAVRSWGLCGTGVWLLGFAGVCFASSLGSAFLVLTNTLFYFLVLLFLGGIGFAVWVWTVAPGGACRSHASQLLAN